MCSILTLFTSTRMSSLTVMRQCGHIREDLFSSGELIDQC